MNTLSFQKHLLGVGVAIALGVGTAACGSPSGDSTATSDTRTQSDARTAVSDTAVTANVKTRLTREDSVGSSNIQVTTNNGVVTLEGTVDSDYAISAAESITRSVDGVNRVDNRLMASQSSARAGGTDGMRSDGMHSDGMHSDSAGSDTWITAKVKSMLLADSVGRGLEISVNTRDGIVMLEGALDNQDTIEHVSEIAADVEGVRRVDTARLVVATRN